MSLHSPKSKFRIEISFAFPVEGVGSAVSFNGDDINALKALAKQQAEQAGCGTYVVISENKAAYWQPVENYKIGHFAPSKQEAIENICGHITNGDTVPMVSGGNGGSGFEQTGLSFDEKQANALKEELAGMGFEAGCEPAQDFDDNVDLDDYTDCVRFTDGGTWYQFLLW